MAAIEEQFRRMVFNVVARNQDDHTKNIAFLMQPSGEWKLSPAFDVGYSYNPQGAWTATHQMTISGKRDGFTLEDFQNCARSASMGRNRAEEILEEVCAAVTQWPRFAHEAGVDEAAAQGVFKTFRLELGPTEEAAQSL